MANELIRLEKRPNREGDEEVFVELQTLDELGIHHYGKWMTPGEYEEFKADYAPEDFEQINHVKHLKNFSSIGKLANGQRAIDKWIDKHLPVAMKHRQDTLDEESYQKEKRLADVRGLAYSQADLEQMKADIISGIKAELLSVKDPGQIVEAQGD